MEAKSDKTLMNFEPEEVEKILGVKLNNKREQRKEHLENKKIKYLINNLQSICEMTRIF